MSNQQTIKQINRNRILDHIRHHGPISRWDIAKQLDLSASAVSSSVSDLIKRDLVYEKGAGESSGGRKPILLDINSRGGLVIAVDIRSVSRQRSVQVAAVDLKGRVFQQFTRDIQYTDNDSFVEAIGATIQAMMTHPEVELQLAISIGIASPGLINTATGEIIMHGRRVRHLPLAERLQARFGCPVVVHNNIDASAFGEYHFGIAQGYQRVLYIRVGYGVGAGFIHNGEIYDAAPISAGEIGHMTILPNGPLCRCGNRGCLSVLVSAPILVERVVDALNNGHIPAPELSLEAEADLSLHAILQAAEQGDSLCRSVILEAAEYVGIAIANYINLLAPDIVVISSELFETTGIAFQHVQDIIHQRALDVFTETMQLKRSELSSAAGLRGIAMLALNRLLTT